jgi:hypothetical protein
MMSSIFKAMICDIFKLLKKMKKMKKYMQNNSILKVLGFYFSILGIVLATSGCDASTSIVLSGSSPSLQLNIKAEKDSAQLTTLGWDTEGTGRDTINLLRSPVKLYLSKGNQTLTPHFTFKIVDKQTVQYEFSLPDNKQLTWEIAVEAEKLRMQLLSDDEITAEVDKIELVFDFNSRTALTSIISSNWTNDGRFQLPVIVSAPDIGQMLLKSVENMEISGYTIGLRDREDPWVKVIIDLPIPAKKSPCNLEFTPVVLPVPTGYTNEKRWEAARRGWFNLIQQSCGASGGGKEVMGVWSNNALSDPVSSLIYVLGDATLLVPELAPGVTMPPILKRTVEYWIDHKTADYGLVGYCTQHIIAKEDDPGDPDPNDTTLVSNRSRIIAKMMSDANPAVIIGAWSYFKASSDTSWLKNRIKDLEFLAQYMENRDIDSDGLIESRQSGNRKPEPMANIANMDMCFDTYLSGHKNAYINVMAFRAFNNLADLERALGRNEQEQRYRQWAEKLKAVFFKTFYNPETGWLGWWRSRDGELHDIYSDVPTSFAVANGLISKEEGEKMLQRYWKALEATGFNRFDLGVPICLRPVSREEYRGTPDPWPAYLNGGTCVFNTTCTLDALYTVGMTQQADMILDAMLMRQKEGVFANGGGFQNGMSRGRPQGAEFFDWEGNTTGYEGHLVYSWGFLHSMLRKELSSEL